MIKEYRIAVLCLKQKYRLSYWDNKAHVHIEIKLTVNLKKKLVKIIDSTRCDVMQMDCKFNFPFLVQENVSDLVV